MKLPNVTDAAGEGKKKPKSWWDTIITSTPVVMTVLATILAGLSSSEMSQSQYYRSLSAQNQSKAGDQWAFFQAKKLRAADAANTAMLMQNLGDVGSIGPESFAAAATHVAMRIRSTAATGEPTTRDARGGIEATLADPDVRAALDALCGGELPAAPQVKVDDADVRRALDAVRERQDETTRPDVFAAVREAPLRDATHAANENVLEADRGIEPVLHGIDKLQAVLRGLAGGAATGAHATSGPATATARSVAPRSAWDRGVPVEIRALATDFAAAKLRFESQRLDREAKLNQQVAYLYEVAVRKSSWDSERHRVRSRYFFFGMLGAQAAVTIASLSLAVREKSWLWSVAATIGVLALLSAGYVYLFT